MNNETKVPTTFTVDRAKWARGGKNGDALLLNADGCMCCLGFLAVACGLSVGEILDEGGPGDVIDDEDSASKWPHALWFKDEDKAEELGIEYFQSSLCGQIISANDDKALDDEDREAELLRLFAEAGITVTFEGAP